MCNLQAGLVAYLEGQLHGGALEEGNQTYPGYLVLVTSAVGLLLSAKAQDAGLLNHAFGGMLNTIYTAKLALLILPQVVYLLRLSCRSFNVCHRLASASACTMQGIHSNLF